MRSRQVSLHTRQVSLPTRRVSLLYVREFGMDSGAATTPRPDALRWYNDALCSASQKIAVKVVRILGFRFLSWVDGFAIGVVRMLIGFARIRSVCESVRIANPSRRRRSH